MDRRSLAVSVMLPDNWSENLAADDASRACEKCGIKFSLLQRKVAQVSTGIPQLSLELTTSFLLCSTIADFAEKSSAKNAPRPKWSSLKSSAMKVFNAFASLVFL